MRGGRGRDTCTEAEAEAHVQRQRQRHMRRGTCAEAEAEAHAQRQRHMCRGRGRDTCAEAEAETHAQRQRQRHMRRGRGRDRGRDTCAEAEAETHAQRQRQRHMRRARGRDTADVIMTCGLKWNQLTSILVWGRRCLATEAHSEKQPMLHIGQARTHSTHTTCSDITTTLHRAPHSIEHSAPNTQGYSYRHYLHISNIHLTYMYTYMYVHKCNVVVQCIVMYMF